MRGLVEADHELVEAERRAARQTRTSHHSHSHKHRSASRSRGGASTAAAAAAGFAGHQHHHREEGVAPITVREVSNRPSLTPERTYGPHDPNPSVRISPMLPVYFSGGQAAEAAAAHEARSGSSAQLLRSANWAVPSSSLHQVPVPSQGQGSTSNSSSGGSGSLRISRASKGYY